MENKMPLFGKINCRNLWKIVYHSQHLDADEYESIFGKVDEGETPGKISVTLCVSEERWETAKRAAAEKGIEISEYIESLISSSTCTLYYWDNKQEAGE